MNERNEAPECRNEALERLISRILDGEASAAERASFERAARRDPEVGALFDDCATIDREVGLALRRQFGRTAVTPDTIPLWQRVWRGAGLAAAAAVAVFCWLWLPSAETPLERSPGDARAESLFAAPPTAVDELLRQNPAYERPLDVQSEGAHQWFIIPTDKPWEFLVIHRNDVTTRARPRHADF